MNKRVFTVDDRVFNVEESFLQQEKFSVESTPRAYDVIWDSNEAPWVEIRKYMDENNENILVIDNYIYHKFSVEFSNYRERIWAINATEEAKTMDGILKLIDFMNQRKFTKGEKLIVVGGGIVQDICAFAGAIFKRGIDWIYFPTTLLSQCDSCIGGKTGINYKGVKNQLALFSAPTKVILNISFIKTLSDRDLMSGMGEILKLYITGGQKFIDEYMRHVKEGQPIAFHSYRQLIMGALAVKKAVVEVDEFDLNYRRSMNYGHTIGHAIEVVSNYEIPHGQAVAAGIYVINVLSQKYYPMESQELAMIQNLCKELLKSSADAPLDLNALEELLKKDKKTVGNQMNFVIVKKVGELSTLSIPLSDEIVKETKVILGEIFRVT